MVWLHYQQLCATGRGEDPYTSDRGSICTLPKGGLIYSATSLLIGPAYAAGGKLGIALLLAVFHLAAVVVFAWGLKAALPEWSLPARAAGQLCGQPGPGGLHPPRRLLVSGYHHRHNLPQHNVHYAGSLCAAGRAVVLPRLAGDRRQGRSAHLADLHGIFNGSHRL